MNHLNWEKYFDGIWCLDYIPHLTRKNQICKEFDRIGISKHINFKFHETFPSYYDKFLYEHLLKENKLDKNFTQTPGSLNASLGHYSIIKKSILYKYERILIIENDVRFLNDINIIENTLNNLPIDYNIILFDYFVHCNMNEFKNYKKINNYYSEYNNLASTGCYSLDLKAMQVFEHLYEEKIYPADVYTSKFDFRGILKKAFTPHNIACQLTYNSAMNCSNGDLMAVHNMYKKVNLNYNEYNMNDGKPYNYGDILNE